MAPPALPEMLDLAHGNVTRQCAACGLSRDSPPNNSTTRDNMCYRGIKLPEECPPTDHQLVGDRQEILSHLCDMNPMNSRIKADMHQLRRRAYSRKIIGQKPRIHRPICSVFKEN